MAGRPPSTTRDDSPFPQSGQRAAEYGAIVTYENAAGKVLTFHEPGNIGQVLEHGWTEAQAWDPTFRIVSICTPQTIYTDLQGARMPRKDHGSQTPIFPEHQLVNNGGAKGRPMLHTRLLGSSATDL